MKGTRSRGWDLLGNESDQEVPRSLQAGFPARDLTLLGGTRAEHLLNGLDCDSQVSEREGSDPVDVGDLAGMGCERAVFVVLVAAAATDSACVLVFA